MLISLLNCVISEVQELQGKVAERERTIAMMEAEGTTTRGNMKQEFVQEKVKLMEETHRLQDSLTKAKYVSKWRARMLRCEAFCRCNFFCGCVSS